ncbi:hypothetical protein BDP55DRAFT_769980 [Colletotrichum godetiae]|uniref:Secreted protein n=1 Tax=Colletotrichum godetiae TaxID=1209918 RepID=A0AAJ0AGL6_9PEZI|nr:uncharacterized protein BDP55DRAFT_769980 [Colletotrichum godetiae]KAK1673530.1 hypothetical protein BDP55DRAFT_769980 [Colletotrichum godetiae]
MKFPILSLSILYIWIASVNADFFHCVCETRPYHTVFRSKEACVFVKNRSLPRDKVSISLAADGSPWAGNLTCRMLDPAKFWGPTVCGAQYSRFFRYDVCKPECKYDGKDPEDCITAYDQQPSIQTVI